MDASLVDILLLVIAGLVLFLFSVKKLSDTIQKAIDGKAKKWLMKFTSNTFTSLLTGMVVTTILGSSSAVIIITIILVNSEFLTFRRAMGIVLGANIGTTVSSQIIATDLSKYSPVLLLVGFILLMISKSATFKYYGRLILYFGLLFFGLLTIQEAVDPLREEAFFTEWMTKTANPITGTSIGAIITLIIQSSSATIGMAIVLAHKGLLGLAGGIAIMIGAELGTCSDTLLATINGNRQALKTGLFHLTFNLLTIILGLILFYPFVNFIEYISNGAPIERSIANAHMLFNLGGVLIFVWTVPLFERILNKMLPDKPKRSDVV